MASFTRLNPNLRCCYVIAGAVRRDALLRFTAEKFVDRLVEGFADDVPDCEVGAADGMHYRAHATVRHGAAPHLVPEQFDVEGIFVEQQFGEVLGDDESSGGTTLAVAFDAFVGGDLDNEAADIFVAGVC